VQNAWGQDLTPFEVTAIMRYLPITLVLAFALALAATPSAAPRPLQLSWKLAQDVFGPDGRGRSHAVYILTNLDTRPLPAAGWAIYFTALHEPMAGSVGAGFAIEVVTGSLQRLVPGPGFSGLAPGQSVEIPYRTQLLTNNSFAPNGVYVVFDEAPDRGEPVAYTAVPFERAPQPGKDPHVITPEAQFELDAAVRDVPEAELPPVFPTPVSIETREGRLALAGTLAVTAGPELAAEATFAAEYLKPYFPAPAAKPPSGATTLRLDVGRVEGQTSREAYELTVDPQAGVRIVGNTPAGVFYGLQSLRSLLPLAPRAAAGAGAQPVTVPALRVVDAPRFGYRGLMLDVARNFQPKAQVFRVLDLMARYKLNVLHFHVTEDEAWRVEMPSLPELTTVGARRAHTLDSSRHLPPAFGSGHDIANPFGSGFYTRADYAEILRHAAARHIEVIPEIEMPGHARAAIEAMEARARALAAKGDTAGARQYLLSDPEDTSVYTSAQRYHDNVMNPALESTYAFIARVVADMVALHKEADVPLRNLHLGGDEVPPGVWERSPAVAANLKEHGLASVDDLWYVFYGRVAEIVKAHGLVPSGWEEMGLRTTRLDGRRKLIPNPDFAARGWTTYVWNNAVGGGLEDLAYRLANAGYKVVLCPVSNVYFDLAWNKNPEEPGLDWGGYVDLRKPFEFIPFDYYRNTRLDLRGNPVDRALFVGKDRLTDYGRSNIVGIQGNLWSETLGGDGRLDYPLVPKLFGLAERAWAPEPDWARERDEATADASFANAYSIFASRVGKRELPRLDRESPAWRYRIPKPGLKVVDGQARASLEIPGFVLRYTTDGSEPTSKNAELRGPVAASAPLRVAAFDTNGRKGHTAKLTAP
jgi:hexosaminidase